MRAELAEAEAREQELARAVAYCKDRELAEKEKITNEEARRFWREYFHEEESVKCTHFARALEAEFDVSKEVLSMVKQKVECHGNEKIGKGNMSIVTDSQLKHGIAITKAYH